MKIVDKEQERQELQETTVTVVKLGQVEQMEPDAYVNHISVRNEGQGCRMH